MTTQQEIGLIPRGRKSYNQVDYSALDRETISAAIDDYIRATFPEQQDYIASSGYAIIRNAIAVTADLLSYRADYLANNCYLPTVTNLRALDNLLSLIGYRRNSVVSAATDVLIIPQETVGSTLISEPNFGQEIRIPARTRVTGIGQRGDPVQFELFAGPTNIFDDIVIRSGSPNAIAYAIEGESRQFRIKSDGGRFFQVVLPDIDVVLDTIRVNVGIWDESDPLRGSLYRPNLPEWERVDFVVTYSEENIYEVRLRNDGLTTITFGNGTFGNMVPAGHDIIVNYRAGGGENGNILPEAIEGNGNFPIFQGDLQTAQSMKCRMVNVTRGVGGRDEESIEEAKFLAPLVYQAQNRAVKDIDYTAFAVKHPKVSKAVAVSRQDIIVDSVEDAEVYEFPAAETQNYSLAVTVHRIDTRTSKRYVATIKVPKISYDNIDEMIIDINDQLGWSYDPVSLSFFKKNIDTAFIARLDKSVEGFVELWIHTGNYQARATLHESGNSILPILRLLTGVYGRVDANYVDLYILTHAEDGTVSVPNAAIANELTSYFDQYKEINTEVRVRRGRIQRVDIRGNVFVERSADPIDIQTKVDRAIRSLFADDTRGLGEPLYVSKIFEAVEAVEGVAYIDQFDPAQNQFPDDQTLLQLGNVNITFYEAG